MRKITIFVSFLPQPCLVNLLAVYILFCFIYDINTKIYCSNDISIIIQRFLILRCKA